MAVRKSIDTTVYVHRRYHAVLQCYFKTNAMLFSSISLHKFAYEMEHTERDELQWPTDMNVDHATYNKLRVCFNAFNFSSFHRCVPAVRDKPVKRDCVRVYIAP